MNPLSTSATPLGRDFETASAQLVRALAERQIQLLERPSPSALDFHRAGRLYQSILLSGGPGDLSVSVQPDFRAGPERDAAPCWELDVSLEVVVRWDPEQPDRAERLHAVEAAKLARLGFVQTDEDTGHHPGSIECCWLTWWAQCVDSVAQAAELIEALMKVQCFQWPDQTDPMGPAVSFEPPIRSKE